VAKYFKREIPQDTRPRPPVKPLTGLQAMEGAPVKATISAQDRPVGLGRRILCTFGLRGGTSFAVPGNTDTPLGQVGWRWPEHTDTRDAGHAYVRLTPGCFPELRLIYMLSGPCEDEDTA